MREIIKFRLLLEGEIVGYERHIPVTQEISGSYASPVVIKNTGIEHSKDAKKWESIAIRYIAHDDKEQYIGFKDITGKEVCKGDIIEIDGGGEPIQSEVGFEEGCFVVYPDVYPDWLEDTSCNWVELYKYCNFVEGMIDIKVIGNIHEKD